MDPVSKDEPDVSEATWDDVPKLLNHPEFPLMLAEFPKESPSMMTKGAEVSGVVVTA